MKAQNLTTRFVESIKPPPAGQVSYYDSHVRGLCLRVSAGGRKVWNLTFRVNHLNRRLSLAIYPVLSISDARKLALEKLREVALGGDPVADRQRHDAFADLAERYLERWAKPRKRSWREDQRILEREVLPSWGGRKIGDIARRDVRDLVEAIAHRGAGVMANRVLSCLSAVFSYAVREDILASNPATRVTRPGVETARERILADHEICGLWRATEALAPEPAAIIKLGLLLAQRRGELVGMCWDEIDLASGWFSLPGARAKNGRANRVPLLGGALRLLLELRAKADASEAFVFPAVRRDLRTFERLVKRLMKREAPGAVFHDLRRTSTSLLASLRIDRTTVKKLLNHSEGADITGRVYDRYSYETERRQALAALDRRLQQIVADEPAVAKVVQIHAGA